MPDKKQFYITTAIYYANGDPHIGHAYELVATDAIARFKRLDGYDVFFLTGSDEHGIKVLQKATSHGIAPQEYVNRNTRRFIDLARALNCSNDDFIRTGQERHKRACAAMWRRMADNGDIYSGTYAGWYSVRDECFYDESELVRADDGTRLSPQDAPVEWMEEESYFFRLSAYRDRLLAHYDANRDFIGPQARFNEVVRFVEGGLRDLSISRSTLKWGVKVPDDPRHVMYVWVDALTNYLSALGFPDEESPRYRFWPADVHIIGKDIVRFHGVYWPAFLMSAGLPLPRRIHAHGFLLARGEKMSKSLGNVVDPFTVGEHYGVDQLRYFFLREVPFSHDGNYSHEAIVRRIDTDLANALGNLAQRCLSMIAKNCAGILPDPGPLDDDDQVLLAAADTVIDTLRPYIDAQRLHDMVSAIWQVVGAANRYFDTQKPWVLRKSDPQRLASVLYVTAETLRQIAIVLQPFMPEAAGALLDLVAVPGDARDFSHLGLGGRLKAGVALPAPAPVFPRYAGEGQIAPDTTPKGNHADAAIHCR